MCAPADGTAEHLAAPSLRAQLGRKGRGQQLTLASLHTMTEAKRACRSRRREPSPPSVDLPSIHPDLYYRELESRYRQSAQYADMVERYPQLRSSIASCHQADLIGDQLLHWDRTHGEV
jgi:hypothetical protein